MSMADYVKCCVCGAKAVYDGDDELEERIQYGARLEAVCGDCAKTHALVALPRATTAELLNAIRSGGRDAQLTALGNLIQLLKPVTETPRYELA